MLPSRKPLLRPALFGAGAILLAVVTPTDAGNLAAVPMVMTPIYTNPAIGLGMINAARASVRAREGHSSSAPTPTGSPTQSPAPTGRAVTSEAADPARFAIASDPAVSQRMQAEFIDRIRAG